jgi:DNA-binding response OmpR family regulator
MITAKVSESDIKRGSDVGANAYIVKPFNPAELISKIKEFMEVKEEKR